MSRIAILYCKRVKDHSCIACAKCYKGMAEKNEAFGRYDEIDLVVPRVKMLKELTAGLERPFDTLHLGTCVKLAMETAECPIDFDELKVTLENKFGIEVVLGTHGY